MNPYLSQLMNGMTRGSMVMPPVNQPLQRATAMMQAMRNPSAFVKQQFPDIPDNIANDPDRILGYLQRTRGISNDQIQQILSQYPIG